MRFSKFILVFLIIGVPVLTRSEVVLLKDGSSFKGTLIKFVEDTLYFKTSFGAEVHISREKIARIEFSDSMPSGLARLGRPSPAEPEPSLPGTLLVEFDNVTVSSTISVHRNKDRRGHERENTIALELIVDGLTVYSVSDSTTDKIIKKGDETLVRNKMKPGSIKVGLSPGLHQVTVVMANRRAEKYRDRLVGGGINKRARADDILVVSGETRRFTVGLKRRKLGLGRSELYVQP